MYLCGNCFRFLILFAPVSLCLVYDIFFHKIGHLLRIVEIQNRYVQFQRLITGHRQQARVVLLPASEQGGAAFLAVHLDLGQAALLEAFGQDQVHIAEIGGDQLLDGG